MRIYSGSYIQIFLLDEGPSTAMNRRQEKSILSTDERRWTQIKTLKNSCHCERSAAIFCR